MKCASPPAMPFKEDDEEQGERDPPPNAGRLSLGEGFAMKVNGSAKCWNPVCLLPSVSKASG